MAYFVEHLTVQNWFLEIFPRLLKGRCATNKEHTLSDAGERVSRPERGRKGRCATNKEHMFSDAGERVSRLDRCFIIEGSPLAFRSAAWVARWIGVSIEPFQFRLVEIRDENGLLLRLRISRQDLMDLQAELIRQPEFQLFSDPQSDLGRLPNYLAKNVVASSFSDPESAGRALLLIQICAWKAKQENIRSGPLSLFLNQRPWFSVFDRYAARHGIELIAVQPGTGLRLRQFIRRRMGATGIEMLHFLKHSLLPRLRRFKSWRLSRNRPSKLPPKVAVEYWGHLNLNQPEYYSDLFFWQQSSLPAEDVLVMFGLPRDPLDEKKWEELTQHGLDLVVTHPEGAAVPKARLFLPSLPSRQKWFPGLEKSWGARGPEARWLEEELERYRWLRHFWEDLFSAEQVKVYVTWYKYDGTHCVIADAMQALGGVTALYQRAYEEMPAPETAIAADVFFGFSAAGAQVERRNRSVIPYYVTVGYLGDHLFPRLRQEAQRVRETLGRNGAQWILAFTDENSTGDERWHTGHQFQRENYAFLLEKLLAEPRLGLILKPKVPSSLRHRLGPIRDLLERALATGRCHLYEGGKMHGSYPPAAAALGSDLMIHGHLCAGTAGLESALAGVPTLLLDREGWVARSPLRQLGMGRVVFSDWRSLWEGCLEHWARPGGVPGFGDWSPMLDQLDPFRDGRAAQRMGTYLQWLLEGFKAGLDRDQILEEAAERYMAIWGKDKVIQVNQKMEVHVNPTDLPKPMEPHFIAGEGIIHRD